MVLGSFAGLQPLVHLSENFHKKNEMEPCRRNGEKQQLQVTFKVGEMEMKSTASECPFPKKD